MPSLARRIWNAVPPTLRNSLIGRLLRECYHLSYHAWEKLALCCALFARTARLRLLAAGLPLKRQFLVVHCMQGSQATGLFSELAAVLGSLEHYERWRNEYAGLHVHFSAGSLYYEPAFGTNWWEYFFEPVALGSPDGAASSVIGPALYNHFAENGELLTRRRGFEIIERAIRPKALLWQQVDAYTDQNFGTSFVIGVHYRGTDKFQEAPRVSYDEIRMAIQGVVGSVAGREYKLFVATDEQAFLDYMLRMFPGKVLYRELLRSGDGRPIHKTCEDGFQKGADAVVDCLLLSRCHYLVRTASALSLCSTFFNPDMPVILLNNEQTTIRLREWAYQCRDHVKQKTRFAFDLVGRSLRYLLLVAGVPIRKEFLVLGCRGDGFFSEFAAVLGVLAHYEKWKPLYAGLRVDFTGPGPYYDAMRGENWWKYYFEKIELGSAGNAIASVVSDWRHDMFAEGIARVSRNRGFAIIDRYIRPLPHIRDKVESFAKEHFKDAFVIGIHYRGTDKFEEAPRVRYEGVRAAVREAIEAAKPARYRLFLATDEQAFLDYMIVAFPEVLSYREVFRSVDGQPIHGKPENNRDRGEDAVVDCLLLSRTNLLIRTASNLSLCSTLFNPSLSSVLLNREQ